MKIGIITIHSIINYGSALQAYALTKYINSNTHHNAEVIDYIYPNKFHKEKKTFLKKIRGIGRICYEILFKKFIIKRILFKRFVKNEIPLSANKYNSIKKINKKPPQYDLYITGSDQVWNPNTLMGDPTYYLNFVPYDKNKIAFSASFAIKEINTEHKLKIREYLSQYSYIGIREKTGISILKDLNLPNHIKISNTCDPTLLVDTSTYIALSKKSSININYKYILVYHLDYAFNPYPALNEVINIIEDKYKLPIIIIGSYKIKYKGIYKTYENLGPYEFLYLFKNAEYIITSSFHGTIFSIIFRQKFNSIIPDTKSKDTRIQDLLNCLGLTESGIHSDTIEPQIKFSNPYTEEVEKNITEYKKHSMSFLLSSLKNNL